jgi:hypothetical protein
VRSTNVSLEREKKISRKAAKPQKTQMEPCRSRAMAFKFGCEVVGPAQDRLGPTRILHLPLRLCGFA